MRDRIVSSLGGSPLMAITGAHTRQLVTGEVLVT